LSEHGVRLEDTQLTPGALAKLDRLVQDGKISFQAAKDKVLPDVIRDGADPEAVLAAKGLAQVSDDVSLEKWAEEVLAANPRVAADFRSGKDGAVMFLVGQVMKKSQGKANPGRVQEIIRKKLSG
jgi:aspartyl-tRNA(Asn)/glutamyl-tRNA(Gln) amidotransferase subunit B